MSTTAGLEDVHNLGLNYHFELPTATKFDVGYFAVDGGNYTGSTQDSGRYTANYVSSDDPNKTDLQEKNMWVGRVTQDINLGINGLTTQLGGPIGHPILKIKLLRVMGGVMHGHFW